LIIGDANIGAVRFAANARFIDDGFQPIERLGDVEFNNRWNTRSRIGESRLDDFVGEGALTWAPWRNLEVASSAGYLSRGSMFSSLRQQHGVRLFGDTVLPSADYTFELIATRDTLVGRQRSRWMKQRVSGIVPLHRIRSGPAARPTIHDCDGARTLARR
jgi:hypothetical protein